MENKNRNLVKGVTEQRVRGGLEEFLGVLWFEEYELLRVRVVKSLR